MTTSSLDYYITPQIYADDCPLLSYFSYLVTGIIFGMIVFHMKCVSIFSTTVTIPERIRQDIIVHVLRSFRKVPVTFMRF